MEKEREIYIKDMLFYILRKWRVILIWMIVLAVAADGFSAMKSYKSVNEAQQISTEDELKTLKDSLNEEDAEKVEDTYETYQYYKESLDYTQKYYKNSIKMQIDPNNVPTVKMQYYISDAKSFNDIINAYSNAVLTDEVCKDISEQVNLGAKTSYISELMDFNVKNDNDNIIINENIDGKSLIVTIIAPKKEVCEKIADVVENKIQEATPEIKKNLGGFKIQKVDRSYMSKADSGLLSQQQNVLYNLNSIKTSISNLNSSLTDEQKNYYNALINEADEASKKEEMKPDGSFQPINVKYIILGLFLGAVLVAGFYGLIYIMNDSLKVDKEIEDYYEIPVLGMLSGKGNNQSDSFIDRLIYKIFGKKRNQSTDIDIQLIRTRILMDAKKKNMNQIHIAGVSDSAYVETMKEELADTIQNGSGNLKCSVGKSIVQNMESLNSFAVSEGVVLVEEIGKSDFYEIGKEIAICLENNITLIGVVVIEK